MAELLLAWYRRHARDLPWREPPGTLADPYRVWLSEIMLQQTTVAAVRAYFERFIARWPTVAALAAAPREEVLKTWAGLGYYARARNLHACAIAVAEDHGGRFPDTEEGLRALPGIGAYTAGAIAAIAFGRKAAAIDGNVERVIARAFAIEVPLPDAKPEIRGEVLALVPADAPGDFAQALMDLGATICTPKRLNCMICPWGEDCEGLKRGIAELLPRKQAKAAVPERHGVAFLITREDGAVLLRRRSDKGLLGGMMEVPSTAWAAAAPNDPASEAPLQAQWTRTGKAIEHTFTHFHLTLAIWAARVARDCPLPDEHYAFVPAQDLAGEALPTVMRKVIAALIPLPPSRRASAGARGRSG
jgi:A/G-specific adenine glycosylase